MEKLYEHIRIINSFDVKSSMERMAKLCEESGELAEVINKEWKIDEANMKEYICEEAADVILCALAITNNYGIEYKDLITMIDKKTQKWLSVSKERMNHGKKG